MKSMTLLTATLFVCCLSLAACKPGEKFAEGTDAVAPSRPAAAPARDVVEIAGIELGTAMIIPECSKDDLYGVITYTPRSAHYPCFQKTSGAGGTLTQAPDLPRGAKHNGVIDIELGETAVPLGVSPTARMLIVDGVIEEVRLDTDGADSQARIYKMLLAKYGDPSYMNVAHLQTAMGGRFEGINAWWALPRMRVEFYGVLRRHDEGLIVASTAQAVQFWNERGPERASGF